MDIRRTTRGVRRGGRYIDIDTIWMRSNGYIKVMMFLDINCTGSSTGGHITDFS
jgi:uncharacterized protein with von Willebrand factor type A (vWA) domain